jgi:hypothetical protein
MMPEAIPCTILAPAARAALARLDNLLITADAIADMAELTPDTPALKAETIPATVAVALALIPDHAADALAINELKPLLILETAPDHADAIEDVTALQPAAIEAPRPAKNAIRDSQCITMATAAAISPATNATTAITGNPSAVANAPTTKPIPAKAALIPASAPVIKPKPAKAPLIAARAPNTEPTRISSPEIAAVIKVIAPAIATMSGFFSANSVNLSTSGVIASKALSIPGANASPMFWLITSILA